MNHLQFEPIYQERVWGGRGLEHQLGRKLPADRIIGESWEIVDREEANSRVSSEEFPGWTLAQLRKEKCAQLMGPSWDPNVPFPILVKWLDCQERLSLQVHPPADVAPELGGEPKTENWYIAEAAPGAALLAGLREGVTRSQFEAALKEDVLESLVCRLPSRKGDSLFVESGRIHAIDAGNLILEIQQNSDTTYRVYDWGRVGLDGNPRQLHVEESLRSIDFNDFEPELTHPEGTESVLVDSPIFRLRRIQLAAGHSLDFPAAIEPKIISVVEGTIEIGNENATHLVSRSVNLILPYAGTFKVSSPDGAEILITDQFI